MKIIAESSTTRTEWVLCDGHHILEHAFTAGLNPYFQTRREISHSVRLELPEAFFRRRWEHLYFYGAGCGTYEKRKMMEASLVAQFKTPCTIESDLLGAARGLLVRNAGLACILGTGSNSCLYDGKEIVQNVRALGYVLGDEGSNAYMGKRLVADILKELAPEEIRTAFFEYYQITPNMLMDEIYASTLPARTLAKYAGFLQARLENPYIYNLVYEALMSFFRRNIVQYDYSNEPLSFVGSTCVNFENVLRKVATDFGAQIVKVTKYSMPGLVEFHATEPHQ